MPIWQSTMIGLARSTTLRRTIQEQPVAQGLAGRFVAVGTRVRRSAERSSSSGGD